MSSFSWLRGAGLLNTEAPDLSEIAGSYIREARGYCTSRRCSKSGARVFKQAGTYRANCPDCGHALIWKRVLVKQFPRKED